MPRNGDVQADLEALTARIRVEQAALERLAREHRLVTERHLRHSSMMFLVISLLLLPAYLTVFAAIIMQRVNAIPQSSVVAGCLFLGIAATTSFAVYRWFSRRAQRDLTMHELLAVLPWRTRTQDP